MNRGVRIYDEVAGSGLPVILHCGGGDDLRSWISAGYVDGLRDFETILLDPRGHGRSDRPPTLEAHRMENYVADVIAVLDDVGRQRAAFWGFSNGGCVAFALAAAHPDRVAALVPEEGSPGGRTAEWASGQREMVDQLRREGLEEFLQSLERAEGISYPQWLWAHFREDDPEMLALELEAWADWEVWSALPRMTMPVLILARESAKWPHEAAAAMPNATLQTLPGGHVGAFLRSDLVLPHVRKLLTSASVTGVRRSGDA